jgi:hypothetical protein
MDSFEEAGSCDRTETMAIDGNLIKKSNMIVLKRCTLFIEG